MKKYNLKLTAQQAEALATLLKYELVVKESNMAKKLLKTLMRRVYKRLRDHCEETPNRAFGMSLSEEVEIAFYCFFQFYEFDEHQVYERTIIESRMAEIDKRIC